jgi:hypothetical protein
MSFAKDEIGKKVDMYGFRYILPPEPPKKQNANGPKSSSSSSPSLNASESAKEKEKERSKSEDFNEAQRDMQISWLSKIGIYFQLNMKFGLTLCYF